MATEQLIPPRVMNQRFYQAISSTDPMEVKQAASSINDFTRTTIREGGIMRLIQPMEPLSNDELDRTISSKMPVKIVDMEANQPGARIVSFSETPNQYYFDYPRYQVDFTHVESPMFTKNIEELRTDNIDIRNVIADNAVKDLQHAEDVGYFNAVNATLMGPSVETPNGNVQWQQFASGMTRTALNNARKIMPTGRGRLEASLGVINNIQAKDIESWEFLEAGGAMSEEMLINGFTMRRFAAMNWLITIKQNVVPTGAAYFFAEPKFLGKAFSLTAPTMYMTREMYYLRLALWETIGAAIGNIGGVARADFTEAYVSVNG